MRTKAMGLRQHKKHADTFAERIGLRGAYCDCCDRNTEQKLIRKKWYCVDCMTEVKKGRK